MAVSEYFNNLRQALRAELEFEKKTFEGFIKSASPRERCRTGLTRFPLQVRDTGIAGTGVVFVDLEPTRPGMVFPQPEHGNGFANGKPIRLFTKDDENAIYGVIRQMRGEIIRVYLPVAELPDEFRDGLVGLDLRFDQRAYEDMLRGLDYAEKARNNHFADLREVMLGNLRPRFEVQHPELPSDLPLNPVQKQALIHIGKAQDLACVHGPPGTGKTSTLVAAVRQMVQRGLSVLVCAASNAAVDHITSRLASTGLSVLRIGNPARVGDMAEAYTLEEFRRKHPMYGEMQHLQKRAAEAFRQADKFRRNYSPEVKKEKATLRELARDFIAEAEALDEHISRDCFLRAEVVCATLTGTALSVFSNRHFDYLVVDESTQAPEPAIWFALQRANALILAGDPMQLPPTIRDDEAKKILGISLMEKIMQHWPESVHMLTVQYRMHPAIMDFSSQRFYGGKLVAADEILQREERTQPIVFYDSAGTGMEERADDNGSLKNEGEAALVARLYHRYSAEFPDWKIGVITPYRAQVKALAELDVPADTIDGFQGQERDIIIISWVRSNPQGETGFLGDERRLNVAYTRARHKLVVIGDSATLCSLPFFNDWMNFVESRGFYDSVWSLPDWS